MEVMERVNSEIVPGRQTESAYYYKETLTAPADGEWVLVPSDVTGVAMTVTLSGGAGAAANLQYYTGPAYDVSGDTVPAGEIVDSSLGAMAADGNYAVSVQPVTAFRVVHNGSGGTVVITARGQ